MRRNLSIGFYTQRRKWESACFVAGDSGELSTPSPIHLSHLHAIYAPVEFHSIRGTQRMNAMKASKPHDFPKQYANVYYSQSQKYSRYLLRIVILEFTKATLIMNINPINTSKR